MQSHGLVPRQRTGKNVPVTIIGIEQRSGISRRALEIPARDRTGRGSSRVIDGKVNAGKDAAGNGFDLILVVFVDDQRAAFPVAELRSFSDLMNDGLSAVIGGVGSVVSVIDRIGLRIDNNVLIVPINAGAP